MPRFNGVIAYPFEVLAQLLWCYFLFGVVYSLLFGALFSLFSRDPGGFLMIIVVCATVPSAPLLLLQFVTMSAFRVCFWPRFLYAPQILTFLVALLLASALGTAALAVEKLVRLETLSQAAIARTLQAHGGELANWFWVSVIASIVGGAVNQALFISGLKTAHLRGMWRWIGGLFVGAQAYDAFVERENARLYGRPFQSPASSETAST